MFLRMVYDDKLAQAAYLIGCQRTGEAIVIDPERDIDRYEKLAKANDLRIIAAAETHIHADFLSGARELAEKGATVYLSDEGDADWKYQWLDKRAAGGPYAHRLLKDGDTFSIGAIEFTALHTPGHTPEHICFMITDRGSGADQPIGIATGDFVFVGDLGRPDLLETAAGMAGVKEGFARTLNKSAVKFLDLPDYLQVWPAHGAGSACGKALGAVPSSTVGYEKRFNASLRHAGHEREFVEFILEGQPAPPLYFARMKMQNRDGVPFLGHLPAPGRLDAIDLSRLDGHKIAIIDTRPWPEFRDGHLPGSLWAPISTQFPMVTGSYVEPDEQIVLICKPDQVEPLVRDLVRIGLDRVTGFATPEDLAANGRLERTPEISAAALKARLAEPTPPDARPVILDARNEHENAEGAIEAAINIAHTRLKPRVSELPDQKPIVCHCRSGVRSAAATAFLRRQGLDVTNLEGGFLAWESAGGQVVREPAASRG